MSASRRKRASFVMLLILAAGLVLAGAAAAARAQEMGCCPAGMEAATSGCTFLGAGDCCPERPNAQAPTHAAPPAPAASTPLLLPAADAAPATSTYAFSHPAPALRTSVLRL